MIVLAMIQLNQGLPSHRIWLFSPWYNWIKDYHLIVYDCSRHDITESRTTISSYLIVLAMIQLNQGLPSHRIWLFSPWYNWIKDYHLIVYDCSRHDTTESRTTISSYLIVLAMIQLNQGLPSHRIWLFSPWYNWIKDYHLIVYDCSRHDITESRTTQEKIRPQDVDKAWYNWKKDYTEQIRLQDVDKAWYNWIKDYTEQIRRQDVDKAWYNWFKDYTEQIRRQDVDKAWYNWIKDYTEQIRRQDVDKAWYNWIKDYTEQIRQQDVDKAWYNWIKDYTEQIRRQDVDKAWYNWIKDYTEQIRPHAVDKPWYNWIKDYTANNTTGCWQAMI